MQDKTHRGHRMKVVLAFLGAATLLAWVAPVSADDATLQEITVTAERRSESLQDVPAAITAISGESLDALHLQGNADLAQQVPSLAFDVLSPGETTLTIRGLGTSYGLEPAVSYYLNETPLDVRTDGYTGAPDIDFFDVDRVEVLRGPQGTLYGSSSMGGAIRVLTAQPNFSAFGVNAEIGGSAMDGGGYGYLAKSAVNIPLSSDLAVRVVGAYEYVPGYINRVIPGDFADPHPTNDTLAQQRVNDAELTSGRIILTWKPTDTLTITPSLVYSQIEAGNNSQYYTNLPDFTTAGYHPSPQTSRLTVGNLLLTDELGFAQFLSSTSVLSHDVDTCADFTLFFANLAPLYGLPYPPNTPGTDCLTSTNPGFTQEFRFTSAADQRLRWVAGAFFSHDSQHSIEMTDSAAFADAIGQTGSSNLYTFDQSVVDQQAAVFADLTFKVSSKWELTAGDRYYELRDSLENVQTGAFAAPSQPLVHAKASGNSPRFVISYHFLSDALLYATAAKGYRPGGPNVGLPSNIGCTLTNAYQPLYDPDSVWNYELGAKTEFLERRLAVNVAAYRIDWTNVQQAVTDPGCGSLFVANVGSARSKGAEAEINFKLTPELLLSVSGSYTDAVYESIAGPFQSAVAVSAGDPVPDVPRQKLFVAGDYTRQIGDYSGFLHLDWSHQGSVPTGFTFKATRPAYSAVDAALGVRREHYEVSIYGHNLTNSVGVLFIQQSTVYSYGNVFDTQIATPPRTVGVNIALHF
jgi:iron complex outermembrane recepter protein